MPTIVSANFLRAVNAQSQSVCNFPSITYSINKAIPWEEQISLQTKLCLLFLQIAGIWRFFRHWISDKGAMKSGRHPPPPLYKTCLLISFKGLHLFIFSNVESLLIPEKLYEFCIWESLYFLYPRHSCQCLRSNGKPQLDITDNWSQCGFHCGWKWGGGIFYLGADSLDT